MNPQPKLFIPGPTEVAPEVLAAMSNRTIGHRGAECARLWQVCREGIGRLMLTESEIVMITGCASAMMEIAVRNFVHKKSMHLVCGAFSSRWHQTAVGCGREADKLEVDWGQGFTPAQVADAVRGKGYEILTIVHNETSTGVTNPVKEIAAAVREASPDTLICVDVVSSIAGMPIHVDDWGLDFVLYGIQKCLALPPGLAIASVSARAFEKAATVEGRGWFSDLLNLKKYNLKEHSPGTPSTAHLYALELQLQRIFDEGLDNRWARHRAMADRSREWVLAQGFELFAPEGYRSDTVTCAARGNGPDFEPALAALMEQGIYMSNGYGKLKGQCFRIGHMGEHSLEDLNEMLDRFESALKVTA